MSFLRKSSVGVTGDVLEYYYFNYQVITALLKFQHE